LQQLVRDADLGGAGGEVAHYAVAPGVEPGQEVVRHAAEIATATATATCAANALRTSALISHTSCGFGMA
jgi:hypothetical protein